MPFLVDDPPRPGPAPQRRDPNAMPEVTVRVVTESAGATRRRVPRLGNIISTLVALALAVALFLVVGVFSGFLHLSNPFGTTTIDRSPPSVLKSLTNLSTYSAARGHYQQTIDLEDDVSILPSFLAGEHTVFIAQGAVDARVDFSRLGANNVHVLSDKSVAVTLPAPTLAKPVVDVHASRVALHSRGLLNRIGSVFSDNPDGERRYFALAEKKLAAAATHGHLMQRAETNTTKMLQRLLGSVGFVDVQVHYVGGTPATGANGS